VPENFSDQNYKPNYIAGQWRVILDGEKLQPKHVQYIGYLPEEEDCTIA
jgi:hypothetical protein